MELMALLMVLSRTIVSLIYDCWAWWSIQRQKICGEWPLWWLVSKREITGGSMMDYSSQGQSLLHLHLSCGASTVNKQKTSGIFQPWERGSLRPCVGPKLSLFCLSAVIPMSFHLFLARNIFLAGYKQNIRRKVIWFPSSVKVYIVEKCLMTE